MHLAKVKSGEYQYHTYQMLDINIFVMALSLPIMSHMRRIPDLPPSQICDVYIPLLGSLGAWAQGCVGGSHMSNLSILLFLSPWESVPVGNCMV